MRTNNKTAKVLGILTGKTADNKKKVKAGAGLLSGTRIRSLSAVLLCAALILTACGGRASAASADSGNDSGQAVTEASAGATVRAAEAASAAAADPAAADSTASAALSAGTTAQSAAAASTEGAAVPAEPTAADNAAAFSAEGKGLVIVLDPGHSSQVPEGTEPVGPDATQMKDKDTVGTYGPASGLYEYDLTMRVSQKLRAELEDRGYTVKLTHFDTVRPISCKERAEVANENHADAFLRIHANSSENTEANGAMTICISESNPYHPELYAASARLSEVILDTYCVQTGARREYVWETDDMTGSNWAEMPTTMIELGYMSNMDEDLKMGQDSYQKTMVNAIADGLDRWFAEMPAEELSMHPALTGEKPAGEGNTAAAASTTSTASAASTEQDSDLESATTAATAQTADAAQDSSAASTDAGNGSDSSGETASE